MHLEVLLTNLPSQTCSYCVCGLSAWVTPNPKPAKQRPCVSHLAFTGFDYGGWGCQAPPPTVRVGLGFRV